jgi:hypothetical protein
MPHSVPLQAVKMRCLAGEMRGHAARTKLPEYRDKFERTACELELQAEELERHGRQFSNSSKSN